MEAEENGKLMMVQKCKRGKLTDSFLWLSFILKAKSCLSNSISRPEYIIGNHISCNRLIVGSVAIMKIDPQTMATGHRIPWCLASGYQMDLPKIVFTRPSFPPNHRVTTTSGANVSPMMDSLPSLSNFAINSGIR